MSEKPRRNILVQYVHCCRRCLCLSAIYDRHCAEVVLSFGISAVVPALVAPPLPELLTKWAATLTPLLDIIGRMLSRSYIDQHIPVFSSAQSGHFTLVSKSCTVLEGCRIECDRCAPNNLHSTSSKVGNRLKWTIVCRICQRRVKYAHPPNEPVVRREGICDVPHNDHYLRTPYPVPRADLDWKDTQGGTPEPMIQALHIAPPVEQQTSGKRGRQDSDPPSQATMPETLREGGTNGRVKKRSRSCKFNLPPLHVAECGCSPYPRGPQRRQCEYWHPPPQNNHSERSLDTHVLLLRHLTNT
jgi:hypothetical protein